MRYSQAVMARFMQPQHVATPDTNADQVVTVGAQDQGAMLKLFIHIDSQTQCITQAQFLVYGCGACIATADWLCERLIGLNQAQLQAFTTQTAATELGLPMVKMHCVWLAAEAIEHLVRAWQ